MDWARDLFNQELGFPTVAHVVKVLALIRKFADRK